MPIIGLLFFFWAYMAYSAFMAGNTPKAVVFIVMGIGLTIYRMKGLRPGA
jgi:hypothetical protein